MRMSLHCRVMSIFALTGLVSLGVVPEESLSMTSANWVMKPGTSLVKVDGDIEAMRIQLDWSTLQHRGHWLGDSYGSVTKRNLPALPENATYTLSAKLRGTGLLWLHIWCYDGTGKYVGDMEGVRHLRAAVSGESEWKHVEVRGFSFPKGTVTYKVVLEPGPPDLVDLDLLVKDVAIRETTPVRKVQFGDVTVTVVKPIIDFWITPSSTELPATGESVLRFRGCRDEYEPGSFVVDPQVDLDEFLVSAGDLSRVGGGGVIGSSSIDIRIVKCWYTGGRRSTAYVFPGLRVLTPDLLLKDDSVVKIDPVRKSNFVKLRFPHGELYTCVSEELGDGIGRNIGESRCVTNAEFPISDSKELCPVSLLRSEKRQYWVTLKIPSDAEPGRYEGELTLTSKGEKVNAVPVSVEVYPFELLENPLISSIYYKGALGGSGTICAGNFMESKNEVQYRAELVNMKEHGVNPPIFTFWGSPNYDFKVLERTLELRREVGLDNTLLWIWGSGTGNAQNEQGLSNLKSRVTKVLEVCRRFGAKDVHFYGIDEARGEALKNQRKAWEAVRSVGGKVYVAGWHENLELMGDIQDVHVRAHKTTREDAAAWHAKGKKILSYANPQGGAEVPETYRCNYGIGLWQADFDGGMTHAYQCAYGNIYNDFDATYRDEVMAYPTVDGVIDTIAWEGYREGCDDLRYLATLQNAIEKAKGTPRQNLAKQAADYLDKLKDQKLYGRADQVREELVDWILKLTQ